MNQSPIKTVTRPTNGAGWAREFGVTCAEEGRSPWDAANKLPKAMVGFDTYRSDQYKKVLKGWAYWSALTWYQTSNNPKAIRFRLKEVVRKKIEEHQSCIAELELELEEE